MSKQKKLSSIQLTTDQIKKMGEVLDLEKKYFNLLWNLFSSDYFKLDLRVIEKEIQNNYNDLEKIWNLKNKLKIPAERLARQYIYKNLSNIVLHIYPSPISSDIAFITHDAVINIDVKTLDIYGNSGDIGNLQFENNQSSFINKNLDEDMSIENSGVKVECLLPLEYSYNNESSKPVLTFFLIIVYKDDSLSFSLSNQEKYATVQLKCLPNGIISQLFENDIVNNFKTYTYFTKEDGFEPIYLTDDKLRVEESIEKYVCESNSKYILIKGRSKTGVFSPNEKHPYYKTLGVSLFPVPRKKKSEKTTNFYLEAVKCGHTNRIRNNILIDRYDSNDQYWEGIKTYIISKKE